MWKLRRDIAHIFCCNLSLAIAIEKWYLKCISFANIVENSILFWITPKRPGPCTMYSVHIWLANKFIRFCMHAKCLICLFGEMCTSLAFSGLTYIFYIFFSRFMDVRTATSTFAYMINVIRFESKNFKPNWITCLTSEHNEGGTWI